jgi:hypothetical protein
MTPLSEHPSVKRFRERADSTATQTGPTTLDAGWLRQVCLDAGAHANVRFNRYTSSLESRDTAAIPRLQEPLYMGSNENGEIDKAKVDFFAKRCRSADAPFDLPMKGKNFGQWEC